MIDLIKANKPFCLIKRKADEKVICLIGQVKQLDRLDQIPRRQGKSKNAGEEFDSLSILPFRQVEELGFVARHKDEKILCLVPEEQHLLDMEECLAQLPDDAMALEDGAAYYPDDKTYATCVRSIIDDEICNGEGCNFVVPRRFRGKVKDFGLQKALSGFRRILANEYGSYWSFLFYTGDRCFIGSTPERHISCHKGIVKMNPISGTFRKNEYPQSAAVSELGKFLKDPKETLELLMVTDEELKMMAEICSSGGQVVGPMLKEMSNLLHTEYVLVGNSDMDIVDMLRQSMFAATVVGGPIENACRVVYRHDPESRRYYGSAMALIGRDADGEYTLDSPITIRTVEIDMQGQLEIGVGTSIVRNSIPEDEVAETYSKTAGVLKALGVLSSSAHAPYRLGEGIYCEDAMIALSSRNSRLSRFWIEDQSVLALSPKTLAGKKITIIDNEDNFVRMMKHMIQAQGAVVNIISHADYDVSKDAADLIILGPGPGDPRNMSDPKIAKISGVCRDLLSSKKPLFCVCLGHQILCRALGFDLVKKRVSFQGKQELINLWGDMEHVGFYNAFVGKCDRDIDGLVISQDDETKEIHAIKGDHFVGVQFHPESILTTNGFRIMRDILCYLLPKGI